MSEDLEFNYRDLWYIKLIGEGHKNPIEKWGGYSQDFADADAVYTHEEVLDSDHDHWGIVGIRDGDHDSRSLLIFDLDVYKADDGFDNDALTVPGNAPLVKSPSGGFHVYNFVHDERGSGKESEFSTVQDLGFDVDIRGSYVSHHVKAPADIPGVGGEYELVEDDTIPGVFGPAEAAEPIRYEGEALLEYDRDGPTATVDLDRPEEPPEDMPKCYHNGLLLRSDPEAGETHPNTHKVNVLTALAGLYNGYEVGEMVAHFTKEYPPVDDVTTADVEKTKYQLEHLAEKIEAGRYSPPAISSLREWGILEEHESCDCQIDYHNGGRPTTAPSDIDWSEVERADAILRTETTPTDPANGLEHKNGCYGYEWVNTDDNGNVIDSGFNEVTNFTLETESILDTFEGEILDITIHPDHPREDSYSVKVPPTVFNEARAFREEIVRGRTTWFDPAATYDRTAQQVLNDLRQTVGSQNAPRKRGTEFIGLHGDDLDEWVTPDGTLTPDGWADDADHVYYPKSSDNSDELESSSVADRYELGEESGTDYDRAEVAELLELLPWTRNPDRGLPVLGWFYAAPVKPLIQQEEGQFNLLQVAGGTGTGKTSTLEMYYQLFGASPSPFSCDDTRFTIEKRLSGSCGFPIWLDEYKPTELREDQRKWLHQKFREVFRGASTSKGRPSLGEVVYHFRAPLVFSGEQTVSKPAVRRRTVITQFSTSATSDEYERHYCEVVGASYRDGDGQTYHPEGFDLESHAIAYFTWLLNRPPESLRNRWQQAGDRRDALMEDMNLAGLDKSERKGLQTVLFGFNLYQEFATTMGADTAKLPGEEELKGALEHVAENIGPQGRRREHIDDFTELLAQAAAAGDYVEEGEHYKIINSSKYGAEKALALHMPSCFSAVKKYVRDYNVEGEYSLLAKTDYVDNFADKADEPGSYPLATSHKVKNLGRGSKTVLLDLEAAADALGSEVTISAFTEDADDQDGAESGEPAALAARGPTRSTTFTAEVATVSDGEYTREAQGKLKGPHGTYIGFVVPGGNDNPLKGRQGETLKFENVTLRTDDDGLLEAVIDDAATLAQPGGGTGQSLDAAADGGQVEGAKAQVKEYVRTEYDTDDEFSAGAAASDFSDLPPARVTDALDDLATRDGLLEKLPDGSFRKL